LIAAGSLLEFTMQKISFPVGRVSILNMTPMNFYEFLKNTGKEKLAALLLEKPTRLSDTIHSSLLDSLKQYMFIGGMPECVDLWRNSNSLTEVFKIQNDLMETYRQDFSKYSPYTDKRSLNHALNSIARNIGHQVKYSGLSEEFTGPTNKKALELLTLALVITRIPSASVASLPFESTALYGALAEQFAGQEFLSSGRDKLYYWTREAKSSSAEVDFILSKKNKIFPNDTLKTSRR
jgi:predicted AAA+ superfamily ATPase